MVRHPFTVYLTVAIIILCHSPGAVARTHCTIPKISECTRSCAAYKGQKPSSLHKACKLGWYVTTFAATVAAATITAAATATATLNCCYERCAILTLPSIH